MNLGAPELLFLLLIVVIVLIAIAAIRAIVRFANRNTDPTNRRNRFRG